MTSHPARLVTVTWLYPGAATGRQATEALQKTLAALEAQLQAQPAPRRTGAGAPTIVQHASPLQIVAVMQPDSEPEHVTDQSARPAIPQGSGSSPPSQPACRQSPPSEPLKPARRAATVEWGENRGGWGSLTAAERRHRLEAELTEILAGLGGVQALAAELRTDSAHLRQVRAPHQYEDHGTAAPLVEQGCLALVGCVLAVKDVRTSVGSEAVTEVSAINSVLHGTAFSQS